MNLYNTAYGFCLYLMLIVTGVDMESIEYGHAFCWCFLTCHDGWMVDFSRIIGQYSLDCASRDTNSTK